MIKRCKKNILKIALIVIILIAPFTLFLNVKADSGWDSDYDSGGYSSSSSSSSDYGSSSSGHYYGGGSSLSLFELVIIIIIIIIIVKAASNKDGNNIIDPVVDFSIIDEFSDIDENEIKTILPDATIGYLKNIAYNNFLAVQEAWMNFDYDKLRSLCTDELYNSYLSQLETLELKNGKNIMSNFKLRRIRVIKIDRNEDVVTLSVVLCVSFLDYVIDTKTNQVNRGLKNQLITNNYELTFVKSNKVSDKEIKCPNCGAKLTNKASNKCEYCDTVIVADSQEFVLSKKTNINN